MSRRASCRGRVTASGVDSSSWSRSDVPCGEVGASDIAALHAFEVFGGCDCRRAVSYGCRIGVVISVFPISEK